MYLEWKGRGKGERRPSTPSAASPHGERRTTVLFRAHEPSDPDADHTDPKVRAEANPSLGAFLRAEDFASAVASIDENEFRRCLPKDLQVRMGLAQSQGTGAVANIPSEVAA